MVFRYFPLLKIINLKWLKKGKHYPSARKALLKWVCPVCCLDIVPSEKKLRFLPKHSEVWVFVNHAEKRQHFYTQL